MSDIKLKPCPFCGGEAKMVTAVIGYMSIAYVQCKECVATTQTFDDRSRDGSYIFSACEAWNRRVQDER